MNRTNLKITLYLPLIISCFNPLWGAPPILEEALDHYEKELSHLRLSKDDLRLPTAPSLPLTLSKIEELFKTPLETPRRGSQWGDSVQASTRPFLLMETALEILNVKKNPIPQIKSPPPPFPKGTPEEIKNILLPLYRKVAQADSLLKETLNSVSAEDRKGFLNLVEWTDAPDDAIKQEISTRRIKKFFKGMHGFKYEGVLTAGVLLLESLDPLIPRLFSLPHETLPLEWNTPHGKFLIKGAGDDHTDEETLKDVTLLIDLGGSNTYEGPAGAAFEGEIRIVIDLGENVSLSPGKKYPANAGSGIFGIGLMILPNPKGTKNISSLSFSQGCGIGGVGGLFIRGTAHLDGLRYIQGAGSFGVGILQTEEAHKSTYQATRLAQGLGLVRGVGIFSHAGNEADIKGGLVEPDPREPLGSVSLCQGVGFGRRAYSGGGVGIATIKGDNNTITGSYFAQGCGYWHSFGIFKLHGSSNTLQARRYDLGSGVHYAFGHFDLTGDNNRILNWGVGPAFGWDHSMASALFNGNRNEIQAEWGTGTASIGSLSFSYIKGDENKLLLPSFGSGGFFRNRLSYAVHGISGRNNVMQIPELAGESITQARLMRNPWGLLSLEGVQALKDLKLKPPVWKRLPREKPLERQMVNLTSHMKEAESKTPFEYVAGLVDVAAAFSVDKKTPREALKKLVQLPPETVPELLNVLEPMGVDQLIQLSVVIPAYGDEIVKAIIKTWGRLPQNKKETFLHFLRLHRPSEVLSFLMEKASFDNRAPENIRMSAIALGSIGSILNKDTGREPGTKAIFDSLLRHLKNPKRKKEKKRAKTLLSRVRFSEGFGLLSTAMDAKNENRLSLLNAGPEDITGTLVDKGAEAFLENINQNPVQSLARLEKELLILDVFEPQLRKKLSELVKSTERVKIIPAVVLLGQIKHPDDIPLVLPFLKHKEGLVRDSAAVALARMSPASIPALKETFLGGDERTRALIMSSFPHMTHPKVTTLLNLGLDDPSPLVRQTAICAISQLSPELRDLKKKLVKKIKRRMKKEKDASVRLTGLLLR